jgi:hypothetical protein
LMGVKFGSGEHSRRVRFAPDERTSSDWGDPSVSCATLTSVFRTKRTFSKSFEMDHKLPLADISTCNACETECQARSNTPGKSP